MEGLTWCKSLTGGNWHLPGEIFEGTTRKYTRKTVFCTHCTNGRVPVISYGGRPSTDTRKCFWCDGTTKRVEITGRDEPATRQRSLCGHAILRPQIKANITTRGGCSACASVYRMITPKEE